MTWTCIKMAVLVCSFTFHCSLHVSYFADEELKQMRHELAELVRENKSLVSEGKRLKEENARALEEKVRLLDVHCTTLLYKLRLATGKCKPKRNH